MSELIALWPGTVADPGAPAADFVPYLKTFLLPAGVGPLGLVMVLPGGGYCNRAPHEADPIAEKFNALGFHAVVLHYRVAPFRYPEPQRDALRAIRIVRSRAAEWDVAPDKIAILGFSAGGHLAACCGTIAGQINADAGDEIDRESSRPDAMILCYPVIRFDTFGHAGSGDKLLGERSADPDVLAEFRLDTRVHAGTPPAYLWHTAADQGVPVENSIAFARAMWNLGLTAALHVFPRGPHGLGLGDTCPETVVWADLAAEFLKTNCGFPARV